MPLRLPWTDARVETLARLWRDGLTATQIARALGGVTRNAVIGKVHRLGLPGRARPTSPGVARPRRPRTPATLRRRPASPRPAPGPEPAAAAPGLAGTCDLLSVGRHACRWPIGEPATPGFALCGRPAVRGAYCAAHGAVAYRPTPPDHLLKLAGLA